MIILKKKDLEPHYHLKISLRILRITGSWLPDETGFIRNLYCVYTLIFYFFTIGIHIFVEVVNITLNYNNVHKIAAAGPLLITNCVHSFKV